MRKLKKTVILATIAIISAACRAPQIDPQIRRIYSTNFNICLCQWYNLNEIKKITDAEPCEDFFNSNFPDDPQLPNIEYCNDLVGFKADAWAKDITPWGKELRRWGNDTCKNIRK